MYKVILQDLSRPNRLKEEIVFFFESHEDALEHYHNEASDADEYGLEGAPVISLISDDSKGRKTLLLRECGGVEFPHVLNKNEVCSVLCNISPKTACAGHVTTVYKDAQSFTEAILKKGIRKHHWSIWNNVLIFTNEYHETALAISLRYLPGLLELGIIRE